MTTKLKISGMTCGNCVKHVTQALQAVPGVERVSVDLESGTAEVDGDASNEQLKAAVEEEGYELEGTSAL